ncbi:hypothetical protein PFICI_14513 [Pestalotiopsis fici W106-1]|uniref:Heterokaryon incompatibility domain-containing protein n=1 Tax=Pestalotiopsis fici (strain W106-1 / CGMCC3.15140) TaxID=1229662 RepID=W3WK77_PESFW|nr:uncharacterized protein PFICI_14513 [Pestalotiopsis fici W106-1]ETS73567.1 hypothetical protein PFICI_14513 [Pestalotiopsis fici W106-1]
MASTAPYQHTPLEYEDSIRVLRLFPSCDPEDPIRVELLPCRLARIEPESSVDSDSDSDALGKKIEVKFESMHYAHTRFKRQTEIEYEALSYTWGDGLDTVPIYLGEHATASLQVTRNCFNALKALRQDDEPRHLWIDAICINQGDDEERSVQVRGMAKIYGSASRTVIYLGEHTSSSRILFQWAFKEVALRAERYGADDDGIKHIFLQKPEEEVFKAVRELIQRPWFHRIWVLQEVFMSRKRFLVCMRDIIPCAVLRTFWSLRYLTSPRPSRIIPYALLPEAFSETRSDFWQNLCYHFEWSGEFLASDSRDKIFALKALLGPQQDELDQFIDYAKTFEEISIKLATTLFQTLGLNLLSMVRQGHDLNMPSWVPDWSHIGRFCSSGHSSYDEYISGHLCTDSNRVRFEGCRISQISELGDTFLFRDANDMDQQLVSFARLMRFERTEKGAGKDDFESIRKYFPEKILEALLSLSQKGLARFLLHDRATYDNGYTFRLDGLESRDENSLQTMHREAIKDVLLEHRIFLCTGTNLVGLAPSNAAKGDILVHIQGAKEPFLLRPVQNGHWRLIAGNCFTMYYEPHALDRWQIETKDIREHDSGMEMEVFDWFTRQGEGEEFIVI